jgi:hypothetical protein
MVTQGLPIPVSDMEIAWMEQSRWSRVITWSRSCHLYCRQGFENEMNMAIEKTQEYYNKYLLRDVMLQIHMKRVWI